MFQQTEKIWKGDGDNDACYLLQCEWDCLFREDKNNKKLQKDYINLLRGLFKGTPPGAFLKLAYITGILPIKKYGTQSALNNFREHTMVSPRQMAKWVGFTEREVQLLCEKYAIPFEEMQRWYDGYFFEAASHVYSPNSVIEAVDNREFGNYWSRTETLLTFSFLALVFLPNAKKLWINTENALVKWHRSAIIGV